MGCIRIILGHYGSGKTQIAVNLSLELAKTNKKVILADLDIVNPYFRTSDSAELLETHGIRLIASDFGGNNLDLPSIPPAVQSAFDDPEAVTVMDVGGDDRGALALGRYADKLGDADILMVINRFRPQTATVEGTLEIMREIETAAHVKIRGFINNSNLGSETTANDVMSSVKYAQSVSEASGLPLVMHTVCDRLYDELNGKIESLFRLEIFSKKAWRI